MLTQSIPVNYNIYALLTPIIIGFILVEMILCWYFKKQLITLQEAIANFGVALGSQALNVLAATGVYHVFGWLWENFHLVDNIEMNVFTFPLLLVTVDFIFYWAHRWSHSINFLWAAHSPHHSSEEMNFFVSLRASTTQRLSSLMFIWPPVLVGFKPVDIYTRLPNAGRDRNAMVRHHQLERYTGRKTVAVRCRSHSTGPDLRLVCFLL